VLQTFNHYIPRLLTVQYLQTQPARYFMSFRIDTVLGSLADRQQAAHRSLVYHSLAT
jgi:hypothetical protein